MKQKRYQIIKKIGSGAMGKVVLAYDSYLNCTVALKYFKIQKDGDRNEKLYKKFLQEAQRLAKINNPNIIRVFDVSPGPEAVISMEYVEGTTLQNFLEANPDYSLLKKIKFIKGITRGLSAIHEANLVHRDLKPANIMITTKEQVKIMDFGISKDLDLDTSATKELIGTPAYMSPEQIRGHDLNYRSDIFSLGSIIYEIIYGQKAFSSNSLTETLKKINNVSYLFPVDANNTYFDPINNLIKKMLVDNPAMRIQDCSEIITELEKIEDTLPQHQTIQFKHNTKIHSTPVTKKKKRILSILVISSACFLALSIIINKHKFNFFRERNKAPLIMSAPPLSLCHNNEECHDIILQRSRYLARSYNSIKCGDGKCTYIERTCSTCSKDCPSTQKPVKLKAIECLNFYYPNNQIHFPEKYEIARKYFDMCSLSQSNNVNDHQQWMDNMDNCMLRSTNPHIKFCINSSLNRARQLNKKFSTYLHCIVGKPIKVQLPNE